jgi:ribonuclease HII
MQTWWKFLEVRGIRFDGEVVGVDEAGRGPLAGPVCVAGVVLPKGHGIKGLKDSKDLKEAQREELFEKIAKIGQVSVAFASAAEIDKKGILVCVKHLMRQVIRNSGADFAILDSANVDLPDVVQLSLVRGDYKVDCVAAASIVAKVSRDRLMVQLDQRYPGYGLAKHKGYGTSVHQEAIKTLGISPLHRKTFL